MPRDRDILGRSWPTFAQDMLEVKYLLKVDSSACSNFFALDWGKSLVKCFQIEFSYTQILQACPWARFQTISWLLVRPRGTDSFFSHTHSCLRANNRKSDLCKTLHGIFYIAKIWPDYLLPSPVKVFIGIRGFVEKTSPCSCKIKRPVSQLDLFYHLHCKSE